MNPIRNVIRPRLQVYKKYSFGAPGFKSFQAYWNWIRANYEMATRASIIKARPLRINIDVTNSLPVELSYVPYRIEDCRIVPLAI